MNKELIYISINNQLTSQKRLAKLMYDVIEDKLKCKNEIAEISKHYKINHKTIKKYLGRYIHKTYGKNKKEMKLDDLAEYHFYSEINKIIRVYTGFVDNTAVRTASILLNNMKC